MNTDRVVHLARTVDGLGEGVTAPLPFFYSCDFDQARQRVKDLPSGGGAGELKMNLHADLPFLSDTMNLLLGCYRQKLMMQFTISI